MKIVLFLANGGTSFLQDIKQVEIPSFCKENGFVVKTQFSTDNGFFVEVDPKQMDISSYYSYSEAYKTSNECWRTFIIVLSDTKKDDWNVNILLQETPFYKSLLDIAGKV